MKKLLTIFLTIIFFQSQAIANPLGFVAFMPYQNVTLSGGGSANINVGGKLTNVGAVIANADVVYDEKTGRVSGLENDKGNMTVSAKEFEYEDLKDRNVSESKGWGVNTSLGGNITDKGSLNLAPQGSTTLSFNNTGSKQKQDTKATLGQGNITIGGVSNPELAGLNRDITNSQEITYDKIERGLDGSVTVDNRVFTSDGRASIASDFTDFGGNLAKATLGATGTIISTGKTLYDVVTNEDIALSETVDAWKANQKTFVNQNNYERSVINELSEGKRVEDIEKAAAGTVKIYHDKDDPDAGFREKGDTNENNNYLNAAHGTATDTDKFVKTAAHEYAHNYSSNEAISESAGKLAGLMWGLGNALNLTSVNTSGSATSTSWYQSNKNSSLLQSNTNMANSIAYDNREHFVPAIIAGGALLLAAGYSFMSTTLAGNQANGSGLLDGVINSVSDYFADYDPLGVKARIDNKNVVTKSAGDVVAMAGATTGGPDQSPDNNQEPSKNKKDDKKQKENNKSNVESVKNETKTNDNLLLQENKSINIADLNQKRLYRVVSEAELDAIKETGFLRGWRPDKTYFTDSYFKSADSAKSRLSLEFKPKYIVEFEINTSNNTPNVYGGTRVKPANGEIGMGREYFSPNKVKINLINYQKFNK